MKAQRLETRIHISLPTNFLSLVDDHATGNSMSRSTFIRVALMEKMGLINLDGLEASPGKTLLTPLEMLEGIDE